MHKDLRSAQLLSAGIILFTLQLVATSDLVLNRYIRGQIRPKMTTSLHIAVVNGYLNKVKTWIRDGRPVNPRDLKGKTPLHLACMKSRVDIVQVLINAGAQIIIQENNGWSPLHWAAAKSNDSQIAMILFSKLDPWQSRPVLKEEKIGDLQTIAFAKVMDNFQIFDFSSEKIAPYLGLLEVIMSEQNPQLISLLPFHDKEIIKTLSFLMPEVMKDIYIKKYFVNIKELCDLQSEKGETACDIAQKSSNRELVELLESIGAATNFGDLPPELKQNIESTLQSFIPTNLKEKAN